MQLKDRAILITGASQGIGAACAAEFRSRGARLALVARSVDKLRALAAPGDLAIAADLTREEDRAAAVSRTVEGLGGIDVLVNNAGVGLYTPAVESPPASVRHLFELNYFAAFELIRLAVPRMRERGGGMIVNVGSIAGKVALPWLDHYSASKAALAFLGDALRMELRGYRIHVLNVFPGYVLTDFQKHALAGSPPESIRRGKQRFAITPERCARDILRGIEKNARTVVTPRTGWLLAAGASLFPGLVQARMAAIYEQGAGQR